MYHEMTDSKKKCERTRICTWCVTMYHIRPKRLLTGYSSHWNYSDSDSDSDSDSGGGIDLRIRVSTHRNTVDLRVIYMIDWLMSHTYRQCTPGQWARIHSYNNKKKTEHQWHDTFDTKWLWRDLYGSKMKYVIQLCYSVCFSLLCGSYVYVRVLFTELRLTPRKILLFRPKVDTWQVHRTLHLTDRLTHWAPILSSFWHLSRTRVEL